MDGAIFPLNDYGFVQHWSKKNELNFLVHKSTLFLELKIEI